MKNRMLLPAIFMALMLNNGQLYAQEPVKNKAGFIDTNSSKEVFVLVEVQPEFPGGEHARQKFLADNIIYPENAKKNNIQGIVFVTFIVETDGSLSNIKILKGIGAGCDEEVQRVISIMPKWKPGKQKGKEVRVKLNLPVKFTLG
jgi:protein TonB